MAFSYRYICPKCRDGWEYEGIRDVYCEDCDTILVRERIIWNGAVQPNNHEPYFNHGLGKMVYKKSDVKEEMKRLEGETGTQIEELGNEDPHKHVKKRDIDRTWEDA